ncbi:OmpA family protein [Amylibacter sp. IMCC11727]|uniref:OmpA family protein n=1 Tax=Amylibacter sp. IMCC11727 TaxID=3039851 RepID=UPI00244DD451|nr:OmpA family protein [Amylibacter sp. IMCC11727]WGI21408.1 OmpA family protein [Amylibacter sp. IMCC11727]
MTHRFNQLKISLLTPSVLALTLALAAPNSAIAQSVSLSPAPIAEYNALVSDWQSKRDALNAALAKKSEFETETQSLTEKANAQQAKIDAAKDGLSSAVVKVASAKKRLSRVDTSDADPQGDELSTALIQSQTELNTVISSSEDLQSSISAMKNEHEKLRSTVDQLKNAAAAAQAAVSAAEVLVEAVKSAQQAISEGDGGSETDLESEFFQDAVAQAENASKSEQAAKAALAATRKRQIEVGERLLKADEQLANAKQAETNAYEKFAAADAAFKAHQKKRNAEIAARNELIEGIEQELSIAQDQLEAQQAILQNESLTMQDFTAQQAAAANTLADLQSDVDRARNAFETATKTLRGDQKTRAVQSAAIIANLNASMRELMIASAPAADTSTATDRVILPASALFSASSAKLQNANGVRLNEIAAILKDATNRVPEGIDWMIRVDSYGTGNSGEAWFLSQNRALSVAQELIAIGKFTGSQVSANGLVNAQPFSDATQNGWIEIVLTSR